MSEYSFYIPAVGNISESAISRAFLVNYFGLVDRVDFFENSSGVFCAFVHFRELCENEKVRSIIHAIETYGSCKFWFNEGREYFILRKMSCPKIPTTYMNIHQIADKLTQHEAKIAENDAKIAELEAKILEQEEIINSYRQSDMIEYNRLAHRAMWMRSPSDDSYDPDMHAVVDSLISPRWPDEDDTKFAAIYPEDSEDTMSVDSGSKRMQMSDELCGNN